VKGRIVIHRELCKGCKFCVLSCPEGVIVIEEEFNASGYFSAKAGYPEKCTGCGLCAEMCPDLAIEVWKEE
jgi:2-oxoglutarate ferredoxin oxidoreductase subunit delta